MKLVVGLGNPGRRYEGTRHNLGFDVVSEVGARLGVVRFEVASTCEWALVRPESEPAGLVLPTTYMNLSGDALRELAGHWSFTPEEVLVVCDDLALPPGRLRLRAKGSDGGHRGLRSIEECLGTRGYPRLKLGVGESPDADATRDYVLEGPSSPEEAATLQKAVGLAADGVISWLDSTPFERLTGLLNRRESPAEPSSDGTSAPDGSASPGPSSPDLA